MTTVERDTADQSGPAAQPPGYAQPFDSDHHYYEKIDAFTRYLDPAYRRRGIEVITRGTHTELLAGGRLFEFVPNPTFDPVIVPGCMDLLFRGRIPEGVHPRSLSKVEPLNPAYQDRDIRLAEIDKQGLSGVLLLPTLACGVEEALKHDIPATMASVTAFNRWLDEDWGYAYRGRIVAAPMLSFADPDGAVAEIERLLARDVRAVSVRPAPVPAGGNRSKSFGDPSYDKVWTALAAAGIAVVFHLSDSGYNGFIASAWGAPDRFVPFRNPNALASIVVADRAIHDTMASLIVDGVFTRHPTLRVASIENGSDWVALLAKRLAKQANQTPWLFPSDPLDVIREHLWVTPYYEEDIRKLADLIGADHVLFGSDWPHGEGLAAPLDFTTELHGFSDAETDRIMRTNALDLLGLPY
ncbi:amidohydrolase family protein [Nocardia sp. alder85J]|uniref:amidohydrolase family protein n=1 Tax=Nocardia sp. alder85J TaxID=2862949 RepID=UPI001CD2B39C|nr:amidohydrolase family protein [Nocardia sp. alder85J]MCX4096771.1 amidohydrolase family protein [Nocardia sp. alder85J]